MTGLIRCFTLVMLFAASASAQVAADNAGNYGSWTNGSNQGSGFLAWSISNNDNGTSIFAGSFIGNSTAGAGNINTSGNSWGLYANPTTAFVNADRGLAQALAVGSTLSFQLALNFDNGNKGFNLFAGSQGEVFNFNVGSGGGVSSANASLTGGAGAGYNYGGNDAVIDFAMTMLSATSFSYDISRVSSSGFQGTLFSGSVSGLTEDISGFRFYVSGTDDGSSQNNLYINSLSVIPEPSTYAMLVLALFVLAAKRCLPQRFQSQLSRL